MIIVHDAIRDLFHQEIFDSVNDELENGDELFTKIIEQSKFDECIKFINIYKSSFDFFKK